MKNSNNFSKRAVACRKEEKKSNVSSMTENNYNLC